MLVNFTIAPEGPIFRLLMTIYTYMDLLDEHEIHGVMKLTSSKSNGNLC